MAATSIWLAERCREEWSGWLDNEWLNELGAGIYTDLNAERTSAEDAADELALQQPPIMAEIDSELRALFQSSPSMRAALELGRCLDQGRHVSQQSRELISRASGVTRTDKRSQHHRPYVARPRQAGEALPKNVATRNPIVVGSRWPDTTVPQNH